MNSKDRAERRIDRIINKYESKIGPKAMEELLQERAQDMREAQDARITAEDIDLGDSQ
jgi:hypothetical protein